MLTTMFGLLGYLVRSIELLYKRIGMLFYISQKINCSWSLGNTSQAAVAMVIDVV